MLLLEGALVVFDLELNLLSYCAKGGRFGLVGPTLFLNLDVKGWERG